jgi:acid phosphatase (class A)
VLTAQRTRTDAEVKRAQADDELSVFRHADVMGAGFAPENLPFATAFFKEVAAEGGQVVNPTRQHFMRRRPVMVDKRVEPVVNANGGSYPSGTAAFAYEAAIWFPKGHRRSSLAPPTGAITASSPACTTLAT